jgi:hypothetical protein
MDFVTEQITVWRKRAADYRADGNEQGANIYARVAKELEDAVTTYEEKELSMAEAMAFSGYSDDALRNMTNDGRVPDLRRKNLPRKPGHGVAEPELRIGPRPSLSEKINGDIRAAGGRRR